MAAPVSGDGRAPQRSPAVAVSQDVAPVPRGICATWHIPQPMEHQRMSHPTEGVRPVADGQKDYEIRPVAELEQKSLAVIEPGGAQLGMLREDPLTSAVRVLDDTYKLAKMLVASGFMPRAIKTPEQAMAVMLTGREMGIGPMQSIRSVAIVDAKPVVAADLQLALFKRAGGRSTFHELSAERAVLWLRHPNGDEHTETWTHADAQDAQLLNKDNWKKHKVAMMRSRVITAGLKSIGFEAVSGAYDPDEADHFAPGTSERLASGGNEAPSGRPTVRATATVSETSSSTPQRASSSTSRAGSATKPATTTSGTSAASSATTPSTATASDAQRVWWIDPTGRDEGTDPHKSRYETAYPFGDKKGTPLDALEDDSEHAALVLDDEELDRAGAWVLQKLNDTAKPPRNPAKMKQLGQDLDKELTRRSAERDLAATDSTGV